MIRRLRPLLLPALALVIAGGCAAPNQSESYFEVLSTTSAAAPLEAEEAWPTRRGTDRFLLLGDGQPTGEIVHEQTATDRFDAEWRLAEGDARERFYAVADNGTIVLHAVIEHGDKAISLFDPPLISIYESVSPGRARTQQVSMRVVHRDDPRKLRDRGSAKQTIEYDENCRVRLGDRTIFTARIELTFLADLGLADVRHTSTVYIVRGFGLIAEESTKTVRMLGLIPNTKRTLKVIAPESAPGDAPPPGSGAATR